MPLPEELFSEHLGLAEVIALEYANTPRIVVDDAISEAQQAILRASRGFDETRGEFTPYAARAVRNALNSLYAKQLKIARVFPRSLDEPPDWGKSTTPRESSGFAFGDKIPNPHDDVVREVKRRETISILEEILSYLSPRERSVVEGMRAGRSLSDIGEGMGMSKQAVHKILSPALQKLRSKLDMLGFQGMDSQGFLASSHRSAGGAG
ncbi:MAG: sigma-70 family RNA polymerase sigma factor [Terrimicrobiaceae bacterium]|nr:sigma-70 family RNA polymerase sigma factor [Terrimicrobiaceae bacterium]